MLNKFSRAFFSVVVAAGLALVAIPGGAQMFAQEENGEPVEGPSTYTFEYDLPEAVVVDSDVDVDVTFETDVPGTEGYEGVRFAFDAGGPGDVTFTATDSEGDEYTFTNEGNWGPSAGFDLPAEYSSTTTWTLNFSEVGEYTINFSLIDAESGEVVAGITDSVTVNVQALSADIKIDPETLNLNAGGRWITAYIEVPEGYTAEDIDVEGVELLYGEESLSAEWGDLQNGILMIKFDRATVAGWFEGLHDEEVELTVSGAVGGFAFEGSDTIRVIDPPVGEEANNGNAGPPADVPGNGHGLDKDPGPPADVPGNGKGLDKEPGPPADKGPGNEPGPPADKGPENRGNPANGMPGNANGRR